MLETRYLTNGDPKICLGWIPLRISSVHKFTLKCVSLSEGSRMTEFDQRIKDSSRAVVSVRCHEFSW